MYVTTAFQHYLSESTPLCFQYSKELVEVVVGKGQTIRDVKEEILKVLAEEGITVDMEVDRFVVPSVLTATCVSHSMIVCV